jgi:flagellar biosynthesis/type III secretory pathway M-ring protein FliF/YscJ
MGQLIRHIVSFGRAALPCCLLFILPGAALGAAGETAADQEKKLEQKAEGTLAGLLGPGNAKVRVRVAGEDGKRTTVFIALSDTVTDAAAQKAQDEVSAALGLSAGRGDDLLVMKPGFPAGGEEPVKSGGFGEYAYQGFLVLAGMFIAFIIFHAKKSAVDEKNVTARRTMAPGAQAKYVPPPAQAQPATPESEELNIPSRSGFYKR